MEIVCVIIYEDFKVGCVCKLYIVSLFSKYCNYSFLCICCSFLYSVYLIVVFWGWYMEVYCLDFKIFGEYVCIEVICISENMNCKGRIYVVFMRGLRWNGVV